MTTYIVLLGAFLFGALAARAQAPGVVIRLVDVAEQVGITLLNICGGPSKDYIVEVNGNGAAVFDYDNDGDVDVLIVNGSTLANIKQGGGDQMVALFRNDGKGQFADVTLASGLKARGWGMGTCIADYDSDGFQDVYVTAFGPNVLFRNNGDGTFTDTTAPAEVGDTRWSTNCAFGDYDRDGNLDLYVANYLHFSELTIAKRGASPNCKYLGIDVMCGPQGLVGEPDALYRNNGDGTFKDVTRSAGIVDPGHYGFAAIFSDLDDDGWPDIFVANDSVPNLLFRNNKDGTFSEIGLPSALALNGMVKRRRAWAPTPRTTTATVGWTYSSPTSPRTTTRCTRTAAKGSSATSATGPAWFRRRSCTWDGGPDSPISTTMACSTSSSRMAMSTRRSIDPASARNSDSVNSYSGTRARHISGTSPEMLVADC